MASTSLLIVLLSIFLLSSAKPQNLGQDTDDEVGDIGQSIFNLITKSEGWVDEEESPRKPRSTPYPSPAGITEVSYKPHQVSAGGLLAPHVEILGLVESFLRLKGEVASRVHALVEDNYDLIRGVYNVLVHKVATLHSFSLTGIQILRRILEFAVQCFSQWQITVPSISYGGSHQTSGSWDSGY